MIEFDQYSDTLEKAKKTWSLHDHRTLAIEECAELIQALTHYERGRCGIDKVVEEIGDVLIMCQQLILNDRLEGPVGEVIANKMLRLEGRIMRANLAYKDSSA